MANVINATSTGNGGLVSTGDDSGVLNIQTNETTAISIDASQNVGVGTSSPGAKLDVVGSGNYDGVVRVRSTGTNTPAVNLGVDAVASADGFVGTVNNFPFQLRTNDIIRATIDTSGNLLVGTTSTGPFTGRVTLSGDSGTTKWSVGPYSGNASGFMVCANASYGVYLPATTSTSWATASDERIKTALEPIENAAEKVSTLRAVTGKYKADENGPRKPFLIAQDVLAVFPEAVDTSNPERYGIAYSEMIPLLVAAIKEQQALITTLTERITALEAK